MIKIGVTGAAGRMGRRVTAEILAHPEACVLSGALEARGSPFLGRDAGELAGGEPAGVRLADDAESLFENSDVVIDFTAPAATLAYAALAAGRKCALVSGTTGLSAAQEQELRAYAADAPIVHASNMSVGVNLLAGLVEQVAARLGTEYDIEIFEAHHRLKKDAPSGTALSLGRAAAAGRGGTLEGLAAYERGGVRKEGAIGFSVFRGGDVVGDHTVTFAGTGERVELSHKAASREIFAAGALRAALWVRGRPAGLYSMRDVLGV